VSNFLLVPFLLAVFSLLLGIRRIFVEMIEKLIQKYVVIADSVIMYTLHCMHCTMYYVHPCTVCILFLFNLLKKLDIRMYIREFKKTLHFSKMIYLLLSMLCTNR